MDDYDEPDLINVGTGRDVTVRSIAEMIRDIVHPDAELQFDTSRPDGMPQKVLDVSRINALGWHAGIDLRAGLQATYDWYCSAHRIRGVKRVGEAA